ncbi:MAG: aldose epimerase family protein [Candidatus Ornithomonoglobus sp.]
MAITKKPYGTMPDGTEIFAYTLDNGKGVAAEIINYGGIITKLLVADKNGKTQDVVLGRASLEEYLKNDGYIGAAIGRHANRIAKGQFEIKGEKFSVGINEGPNSLHGGVVGFDQKVWSVTEVPGENAIILSYISLDGEEGFPGTLSVAMRYSVTEENALKIEYRATADKDTVCNLTNHSYFNLSGHESGSINDQILQINAGFYTPNDSECMPTGEVLSVAGTPFDFRAPKPIGQDIDADFAQIQAVGGFDHNFVISGKGYRTAAVAKSLKTGITMQVLTNQPSMQLYTANALPEGVHKGDVEYKIHDAFCLETQVFPNALTFSHYPGPILTKGHTYNHITEYKFI